jgi:hypothetical protein
LHCLAQLRIFGNGSKEAQGHIQEPVGNLDQFGEQIMAFAGSK